MIGTFRWVIPRKVSLSSLPTRALQRAFISSDTDDLPFIDLRSDTVTAPSKLMLEVATQARTGDDVYGEDPSVNALEEQVAHLFGKEKGLFLPTGTMANLVAVMAHCPGQGSEIMVGANSHMCLWEGGNVATLAHVHPRQLVEDEMTAEIDPHEVLREYHNDSDDHCAKTELVCLENTHNMLGGVALSKLYIDRVAHVCKIKGMRLHIDGARICNAVAALNVKPRDLCRNVDSVSICLSKGLGAPMGSVLVGDTEFIRLARRARKRCGGGMRQAGVMAAMGKYAIDHNFKRLKQDHRRAKTLASYLRKENFYLPRNGIVDTNIVFFGLPDESKVNHYDFCRRLESAFYKVKITGPYKRDRHLFRAVTHFDITDEDIERAAECIVNCAKGVRSDKLHQVNWKFFY
jgi:threonine aldolase